MIEKTPLSAILSCNLIGDPYIALEHKWSDIYLIKTVRCQTVIIISDMRIPDLIYILHALHVTICMRRHQCYARLPMYYRMA